MTVGLEQLHRQPDSVMSVAQDVASLARMDGHKLPWHMDRVEAWERGERIAPVLIDIALTRKCDYACKWCYAMLQENDRSVITKEVIEDFLVDCARMGVRAISLLSDGESVLSPVFTYTVNRGKELGMAMASGSNCRMFTPDKQEECLKNLSYIRINFPAGTRDRYCEIVGAKPKAYDQVLRNIRYMVALKKRDNLDISIGWQMVMMPEDADQIIPFVELGRELGVDFAIIKHTADDEYGSLGVEYAAYEDVVPILKRAETYATDTFHVKAMWSKITSGGKRSYKRCYGPPFILQISGSGLVAPCGDKFNDRYAALHIGNICEERWWDIWKSDRYWEVMNYLGSEEFNPQTRCGPLCRQHKINEALDKHIRGVERLEPAMTDLPRKEFL